MRSPPWCLRPTLPFGVRRRLRMSTRLPSATSETFAYRPKGGARFGVPVRPKGDIAEPTQTLAPPNAREIRDRSDGTPPSS